MLARLRNVPATIHARENAVIAPGRLPFDRLRVPGPIATRRTGATYVGVAALIAASIVTLPVAGYPMPVGGEFGYQAAMIVALREHLQWGSQIVWAYGPYGYLNEPAFMDWANVCHAVFRDKDLPSGVYGS